MMRRNRRSGRKTGRNELTSYSADRRRLTMREGRLVARTLRELVSTTTAHTEPGQPCALPCFLGLVLGRTGTEALGFRVYRDTTPEVAPVGVRCALNLSTETARLWPEQPRDGYAPAPVDAQYLAPHVDYIDLHLPAELFKALKFRVGPDRDDGTTVGDILNVSASGYAEDMPVLNALLKEAGVIEQLGSRKIANILAVAIERRTGDTLLAHYIASDPDKTLSLEYYVSYARQRASVGYRRALDDLLVDDAASPHRQYELVLDEPTPPDSVRIGSHLYANASAVRRLISGLYSDALSARKNMRLPECLVHAHNTTVAYVITMLLALTGARPVWDPLCRDAAFVDDLGGIAVSDKVTDKAHAGRLVLAPTIVFEQLRLFRRHLKHLVHRLAAINSTSVDDVQSILAGPKPKLPMFFFLANVRTVLPVCPKTLEAYHSRYWSLPANTLRHRLGSDLVDYGIPFEYVAHQFGHLFGGLGPFHPFSTLSPVKLRGVLVPALESIARAQGWRALKGIQTYGHGPRQVA